MRFAALAVVAIAIVQGPQRPPAILQVFREPIKPGVEAEYDQVEKDQSRVCAELKCPHPYLGLESLTGPKEAWFFNGYTTDAEVKQVAAEYAKNKPLAAAMGRNARRKATLTLPAIEAFASYRSASANPPWLLGQGRYLVITMTKSSRALEGTMFETPEGIRFVVSPAGSREDADAKVAAAGGDTFVFAVRPDWSHPAPEWIAADPEFWRRP